MKIWLWIIGIFLFVVSVVIGALQQSEVQYQVGKFFNEKGVKIGADWYFKAAIDGDLEARSFFMNSFTNEGIRYPEYVFYVSFLNTPKF